MPDLLKNVPVEVSSLHKKAKQLIQQKFEEEYIINKLIKEGISIRYAKTIIENIVSEMRDRKQLFKMFIMALFIIAGGLLLNYLSYNLAVKNGGIYMLIFWGIIVSGTIMFIKAISMYKNLPRW